MLGSEFDEIDVPSGRTLTKQGEPGREFVVIVSGTAEVTKDGRRVNMLGAGDFLGEIALLSGGPRTATVHHRLGCRPARAELTVVRAADQRGAVAAGERRQGAVRASRGRRDLRCPVSARGRADCPDEADRRRVLAGVAESGWRPVGLRRREWGAAGCCSMRAGSAAAPARPPRAGRRVDAIAISHWHLDHWGDLVPWVWGLQFGPASGAPGTLRALVPPGGPRDPRAGSASSWAAPTCSSKTFQAARVCGR